MKPAAEQDFIATLIEDALGAIERDRHAQSQCSHRDLVRTLFATAEGLVAAFREHIVEAAADVGELKEDERIALSEEVYSIGELGRITAQRRYISIRAMIRLCARIAQRLDPELDIAFDDKGWNYFRSFIEIRNRLTHPKGTDDLRIGQAEVDHCMSGFFWLMEVTVRTMESANRARQIHLRDLRSVFALLQGGDADTLELYKGLLLESPD